MHTYRERGTFLQGLHPVATVMLIGTYIISFLVITNPIYLMMLVSSLLMMGRLDGCLSEIMDYGKIVAPFVLIMMIVNPLLVHDGSTVLYRGTINFPVMGVVRITLEAIIYGLFMGVRIMCVTCAFGFGNMVINADRSFAYFSKYLKKSALLMSMTINLFPRLMREHLRITEIEKMRGNAPKEGTIRGKIKSKGNIINILFLSSIEDSSDMAESMYSRGYGIGNRSSYFQEKVKKEDIVVVVINIVLIISLIILKYGFLDNMAFYPKVSNPFELITIRGFLIIALFFLPSLVTWRYEKWRT